MRTENFLMKSFSYSCFSFLHIWQFISQTSQRVAPFQLPAAPTLPADWPS